LNAAEQQHVQSMLDIAYMFVAGKDVPINYEKAAYWFTEATKFDSPSAYNDLGNMYKDGLFFEKNPIKALEHYEKAAALGANAGQYNLALMYLSEDSHESTAKGLKLLKSSANDGYINSINKLCRMYIYGDAVPQDYAEAYKLAVLSASQNNVEGQSNLGVMLTYGHGCEQNLEEAFNWTLLAAQQGKIHHLHLA
jgi:TPR repeat protein